MRWVSEDVDRPVRRGINRVYPSSSTRAFSGPVLDFKADGTLSSGFARRWSKRVLRAMETKQNTDGLLSKPVGRWHVLGPTAKGMVGGFSGLRVGPSFEGLACCCVRA